MSASSKPASNRSRPSPSPQSTPDTEVGADAAGSVLVGMDGSDCSELALRWAVNKSGVLGRIVPISVYQTPSRFDLLTRNAPSFDPEAYRTEAEDHLRETVAAIDPQLGERAIVMIEAHPGPGLVEAAKDANLLVVGTRGRSGITAVLLGSVSSYCVEKATVPTVVIPPGWPADEGFDTLVVGIDGSENADAALQWALDHVAENGTVVAAAAGSVYGYTGGQVDAAPARRGHQIQMVEDSISRVSFPSTEDLKIVIDVDQADARMALPRIASDVDADLLILGSRGVTGIPYLLLGSVSTALVHHPARPTLIVPSNDRLDGNL